ncbi:MAG TPA: ANTAR domain-containing protein [Frankiaceae bacterium]|nr:ANTAR domain-containing protein [Frankiaceae bacterium]
MTSSQHQDSEASGARRAVPADPAAAAVDRGKSPGDGSKPDPRSVADVLDAFTHARLLAELDRAHEQIAHLEVAVESNRDIGTAIGIVMTQDGLTKEQAFDRLRAASQATHRKLRDIGADVVNGGSLLQSPPRGPAPSGPIPRPPSQRRPGAS